MTPLEIVITSIGGSAALFAIVGFLSRSLVPHLLSKDIATFKSDLEKIAYEHQVRFRVKNTELDRIFYVRKKGDVS